MFRANRPVSSAALRKKTEALQALEDATGELETKINAEINSRVKYVKAGGQEIVWLLLRRIVVLGVITDEQKAELKRLLQKWRAAKDKEAPL